MGLVELEHLSIWQVRTIGHVASVFVGFLQGNQERQCGTAAAKQVVRKAEAMVVRACLCTAELS